ncbi:MAG: hypothetical protein ACR2F8_07835 [Caulobacteraceae bacterium]
MTTLIQTIEADLSAVWGGIVHAVETDAVILWNDFKATFTSLLPAQYAIFKSLALEAIADVAGGDFADLETAVLNKAEAAGIAFVADLTSPTIQALLAMLKAAGL